MEARKDINARRTAEIHVAWLRFYTNGANNHNVHPWQKLWTLKKNHDCLLNFIIFGSVIRNLLSTENQFFFPLKHPFCCQTCRLWDYNARAGRTSPHPPPTPFQLRHEYFGHESHLWSFAISVGLIWKKTWRKYNQKYKFYPRNVHGTNTTFAQSELHLYCKRLKYNLRYEHQR